MSGKQPIFKSKSLRGLLISLTITFGTILILALVYFYIYLPSLTNHGESITVPDLTGMDINELDAFLEEHDLRFTVNDSAYSADHPPLVVLRQFPHAGSKVKENRMIYVSLNRVAPPTLPMPDLVDRSLINATVVLKSNELKRGRILYVASPFQNLVKEMKYKGEIILPGTRIPKGAVIDVVVGDGHGPADFVIGNLINDTFERAKFKLGGWDLHLGSVQIPEGIDTTDMEIFVYKQYPLAGDSVRVGDPVDLWIGPKGYEEPDSLEVKVDNNNR
jgi:eukaryotic-like serine/threonine-protein kinase